jgi:hypothetical protein
MKRFLSWTPVFGIMVLGLVQLIMRQRAMNWGATPAEVGEQLPGDELAPHPLSISTRAITIAAPPSAVWPWIVQMGYKRAGFYS